MKLKLCEVFFKEIFYPPSLSVCFSIDSIKFDIKKDKGSIKVFSFHLLFKDDLKLYCRREKGLDSLVQTVRVFSEDIGMEFGIQKCAMLVMEKVSW